MSWPPSAGCSSVATAAPPSRRRSAPFRGRGSSTIEIACSGRSSGTTASTRFRKARAVLAFSQPVVEARGDPDHAERQQVLQAAGSPRSRSRACSAPRRACRRGSSSRQRRRRDRPADRCRRAAAGRRCGSAAGRSGRSGRRIRSPRGGRCRASRIRAAGAVVGLLGAQVALDLGIGRGPKAHGDRHSRRRRTLAAQSTAIAVWKTTVRPLIARSCAVACAGRRACR